MFRFMFRNHCNQKKNFTNLLVNKKKNYNNKYTKFIYDHNKNIQAICYMIPKTSRCNRCYKNFTTFIVITISTGIGIFLFHKIFLIQK
jgi:hypothetical protein